MKRDLNDIDRIITLYLSNEASSEEKAKLESWINLSKENRRYFTNMVKVWEYSITYSGDNESHEKRFQHFQQQALKRRNRRISYITSAVAAVALLVLAINFFIVSPKAMLTAEANSDEKKEIVLPDGSTVWLNRNSTIHYPKNFTKNREVQLKGEAYFDVVQNIEKPFTVETPSLQIEVLGTTFVVTDYDENKIAETVLKSGKINLVAQKTGDVFLMGPNQMIKHDKTKGETKLEMVDAHNFTDWVKNSLVFDNTRLENVFIQLEKWYGIRIVCEDASILRTPVSFTVDVESKEEILDILQGVVSFSWEQNHEPIDNKSTIIITSKS